MTTCASGKECCLTKLKVSHRCRCSYCGLALHFGCRIKIVNGNEFSQSHICYTCAKDSRFPVTTGKHPPYMDVKKAPDLVPAMPLPALTLLGSKKFDEMSESLGANDANDANDDTRPPSEDEQVADEQIETEDSDPDGLEESPDDDESKFSALCFVRHSVFRQLKRKLHSHFHFS